MPTHIVVPQILAYLACMSSTNKTSFTAGDRLQDSRAYKYQSFLFKGRSIPSDRGTPLFQGVLPRFALLIFRRLASSRSERPLSPSFCEGEALEPVASAAGWNSRLALPDASRFAGNQCKKARLPRLWVSAVQKDRRPTRRAPTSGRKSSWALKILRPVGMNTRRLQPALCGFYASLSSAANV